MPAAVAPPRHSSPASPSLLRRARLHAVRRAGLSLLRRASPQHCSCSSTHCSSSPSTAAPRPRQSSPVTDTWVAGRAPSHLGVLPLCARRRPADGLLHAVVAVVLYCTTAPSFPATPTPSSPSALQRRLLRSCPRHGLASWSSVVQQESLSRYWCFTPRCIFLPLHCRVSLLLNSTVLFAFNRRHLWRILVGALMPEIVVGRVFGVGWGGSPCTRMGSGASWPVPWRPWLCSVRGG